MIRTLRDTVTMIFNKKSRDELFHFFKFIPPLFKLWQIVPIGITFFNPTTNQFEWVNSYVCTKLRRHRSEIINQDISLLYTTDTEEETKAELNAIQQDNAFNTPRYFRNKWQHKNKSFVNMHWISVKISNFIVSIVEIYEEK